MTTINNFSHQLERWAQAHYGAEVKVGNVGSLGGHSGITIGFDLVTAGQISGQLVLKVPPPGVRRTNNFDVLRQVPLLQVLAAHEIAAPTAEWWSNDESWFGSPYLMMSRLRGASLPDIFAPNAVAGSAGDGKLFYQAIEALVKIHSIDGEKELSGWSTVRLLPQEIDHWVGALRKSTNLAWIEKGLRVHKLLHESAPKSCAIGIVHGDFYSNNWLFDDAQLTGIVDWENTTLGPVLLDLGCVCMMYDMASWGPMRRASMGWHPDPESLIGAYARHSTIDLSGINWYRALAGYRLACNTAYYFEQHSSGKRPNPAWDVLGDSFPFMLDRALELLET